MKKTLLDFKRFLNEKCNSPVKYKDGKYDRKIYNWFQPTSRHVTRRSKSNGDESKLKI